MRIVLTVELQLEPLQSGDMSLPRHRAANKLMAEFINQHKSDWANYMLEHSDYMSLEVK